MMPQQTPTALGGITFHTHADWCLKLRGYIDRSGYTYGYESQTLQANKLAREVTGANSIPDFITISHEQKKVNEHDAFETFGVAPVAGTNMRVLIRRVNFVRPKYDLVDVRTCWFAAPPARMERMLTDSDEVLATFTFETGPVFPNSWVSHYRRFDVDGEGSEFVVYQLRPKYPFGDQDIYQEDWCAQYGLTNMPKTIGFTTREFSGVEAREIAFLQGSGETELLGARVLLSHGNELFVFQLVSSGRHFSIERGRFEQVLSSIRLPTLAARASKPASEPCRSTDTGSSELFDLEARREATPWETDPRGRTALEMRVLLRTFACVQDVHSRNSAVFWFMRRRCLWVLERLDVESPEKALAEQQSLFKQALENLPDNFDLLAQSSLTKIHSSAC
ncbi:MAG: hypothetical protein ACPG4T_16480 [Nannocystaceae bacterium]